MKLESGNTEEYGEPEEVIAKYIKHSVEASVTKTKATYNSIIWDKEKGGHENFMVEKSWLVKENDGNNIYIDEAFNIRTQVQIFSPEVIGCVYHIHDSTGAPVFTSFALEEASNQVLRSGMVIFDCYFPPNLFNRGVFKLSLFITDSQNEIYHLGEAFYFEISLRDNEESDNFFYRKYPGPLRPRLSWKIQCL